MNGAGPVAIGKKNGQAINLTISLKYQLMLFHQESEVSDVL
jgi:hypothetical protein